MKGFKKAFLLIAIPVSLQYLLRSSLNFVDTIMVGQLGDVAIAGVGIGNQIYFLMNLFLLGITSGTGIFVTQFYGQKDRENIKKVTGLGLVVTTLVTIIFTVLAFYMSTTLFKLFTKDLEVITVGSTYLKVVSLSYIITGITAVFSTVTRSTGKASIPLIASIVGLSINTIGNYIMIFGYGPIPAYGVKGAAYATIIARFIEGLLILVLVYRYQDIVKVGIKHIIGIPKNLVKRFFKESVILIIKDALWGFGLTVYIAIYARMGTEVVAAINIVNTIRTLAFVFMIGIANAGSIIIGQALGAKRYEEAYEFGRKLQVMTLAIGGFVSLLILLSRPYLLSIFKISPQVYQNANDVLLVLAIFFTFESFSMISVMGILRSGADNQYCFKLDFIAMWLIGIPLVFVGGIIMSLPIGLVYGLSLVEELYRNVRLNSRVKSKKWMNNVVNKFIETP